MEIPTVQLFEETPRTFMGPGLSSESTLAYLDRSARTDAASARQYLEHLFAVYPPEKKAAFKKRLHDEFESAFFELFIHDLLRSNGAAVVLHPKVSEKSTRPDFLARFPSGDQLIVEAIVSKDMSAAEQKIESQWERIFDHLNRKLNCPVYWIAFGSREHPELPPTPSSLCRFVQRQIDEFTQMDMASGGNLTLPTWLFQDGTLFSMEISLIRRSQPANPDDRPIGVYPWKSRWGGGEQALLNAIKAKATKYGPLELPFVVAINALSRWGTHAEDVTRALYGGELNGRATGGLFSSKYSRLSGVLVTKATAWGPPNPSIHLYHNPQAQKPCGDIPWQIPQTTVIDGQIRTL